MSLSCILSKIRVDVFEKSPLFCIPNFGPKRPFFGPVGPILTQNLKNIVKLVVITQNHAFQGKKWSLSDYVIFGVCRPPNPTPLPPQTPPMVPGGQKWPKCTCTSPVLIINDKKTTFGWVNILTYFFTRNVPKGKSDVFKQTCFGLATVPTIEYLQRISHGRCSGPVEDNREEDPSCAASEI